jgi:hypothetical protein
MTCGVHVCDICHISLGTSPFVQQACDRHDEAVSFIFHVFTEAVEFLGCRRIDAHAPQVFLEDGDVFAKLVDAAMLHSGQAFLNFLDIYDLADRCGGAARWRGFLDKVQATATRNRSMFVPSR